MNFKKSISLVAAAGLCLGLASTASAQNYTVLDLGNVTATALNDLGQVTGVVYGDSPAQAFYTGANGIGFNTLVMPTGGSAHGAGINNRGQVVGNYSAGNGLHGFVTGAGGQGVTDVVYPNAIDTSLVRINASGQVLGVGAAFGSESYITYLTGPSGQGFTQVSPLDGTPFYGSGLNKHGDVVGQAFTEAGALAYFVSTNDGTMTNLGTLGGLFSRATGINDQGAIVGFSTEFGEYTGTNSTAFVIGAQGQDMVKLSTLLVGFEGDLNEALAINNVSQILASDGNHSYLLTPTAIPETQTSVMLMLGLLGMAWVTGRRAKTAPPTQT